MAIGQAIRQRIGQGKAPGRSMHLPTVQVAAKAYYSQQHTRACSFAIAMRMYCIQRLQEL
jgi:hypothetical protein